MSGDWAAAEAGSPRITRDPLPLASCDPGHQREATVTTGSRLPRLGRLARTITAICKQGGDRWDESATLARSAVSYATLVGNPSLQAWTLGLAALLANWRNEPDTALNHLHHGMHVAPPGIPAVRLRYIASRSYALLGDPSSVQGVLEQARHDQDDAERHCDPLADEIGGEFAFGRARAEACAAAAWLDLGRGQEAQQAAELALNELSALPACCQSLSQVTGARIDLATACLIQRERDQAEEILGNVFAVPSPLRNVSLLGRLERTRKVLDSPSWAEDGTARQISDSIGELLTTRP